MFYQRKYSKLWSELKILFSDEINRRREIGDTGKASMETVDWVTGSTWTGL